MNRPNCPIHTYNRDGFLRFDENGGEAPNYEPNSFSRPAEDPRYRELPYKVDGEVNRFSEREVADDCLTICIAGVLGYGGPKRRLLSAIRTRYLPYYLLLTTYYLQPRVLSGSQSDSRPIHISSPFCQCRQHPVAQKRTDRHRSRTLLSGLQY